MLKKARYILSPRDLAGTPKIYDERRMVEPSRVLRRSGKHYLIAVLSGLLLASSFAPLGWYPAPWAALALLFYAVLRSSGPWQAAELGLTAGLVFYTLSLSWMPNVVSYRAIVFWCVFALWIALHAAIIRGLWEFMEERGLTEEGAILWAAAAGAAWAGIEYFRSEVWTLACPWLGLGYSQTYNPPLFQSLSVWGVYGLSGFMAAFSAAWALTPRKRLYLPAAVFSLALVVVISWGGHRLKTLPAENGVPVKVALVQSESSDIDKLAEMSLTRDAAAADLLVWPEYSFYMPGPEQGPTLRLLEKKLKASGALAMLGAGVDEDKKRGIARANFILVLGRDKKPIGRYDKMYPVQFVETGLRGGRDPHPVDTPLGKIGPQICYDLAFEDGARIMARQGARLLVVPTLDPMEWGNLQHTQHSDMSAARSVESGLWLVRAASSGRSQVIDRLGTQRAALANGKEGTLTASAYVGPGGTFYTRWGWLFAPACLVFTLAAAVMLLAWRMPWGKPGLR